MSANGLIVIIVAIVATMMGARSERFRRARSDLTKTKASIGTLRKAARAEVARTLLLVAIGLFVIYVAVHA